MWTAIVSASSEPRREAAVSVVDRLRAQGVVVAGALQESAPPDVGGGWDAVDLATGQRLPIARRSATPELCDWEFDAASFASIRASVRRSSAPVVVLEFGLLEARSQGNWPTAMDVLATDRVLVACIRPTSLARIALELPDVSDALELPVRDEDIDAFVGTIAAARAASLHNESIED